MTHPPSLATAEGTARYASRFQDRCSPDHFRQIPLGLTASSIGLGTYLGDPDDEDDRAYEMAISLALQEGCNVLDAAINYRCQRSERDIGNAVKEALARGQIQRDELLVCTKGGYVAFDGEEPDDPFAWLKSTYLDTGIAPAHRVVEWNCIHPRYIEDQIGRSLHNLGGIGIDVYYLHNPEAQLQECSPGEFMDRLEEVFPILEKACKRGEIGAYGLATWDGFRVPEADPGHLPLGAIWDLALKIGGPGHRFRAVQMPLNLGLPEALLNRTQSLQGERLPALAAAHRLGLTTFTSGSILQGELARSLSQKVHSVVPGLHTDAQRALQWTRSSPFVDVALVGMRQVRHVEENLHLARVGKAPAEAMRDLVAGRK